jgi:hypothetical protein
MMRSFAWFALLGLAACGRRVPVLTEEDPEYAYELPQEGDECAADLGCKQNGCGQYCTAADAEDFVSTCEWPAVLDGAQCGCLRRECSWYTVEVAGPELPAG